MADNVSVRPTDVGSKAQTAQNRPTGGLFTDLLGFDPLRGFFPALTQAPSAFGVEINRTENGYTLEIPVPGFRPEQIEVTVQDDTRDDIRKKRSAELHPCAHPPGGS